MFWGVEQHSIPALHSPDANSTFVPSGDIPICLQTSLTVPWGTESPLGETHQARAGFSPFSYQQQHKCHSKPLGLASDSTGCRILGLLLPSRVALDKELNLSVPQFSYL